MGRLDQDLAAHTLIAVDTAPFIYFWEHHSRYFHLSEQLLQYLNDPQVQGVTSVITLIEACILPQRAGRQDLVQAYERALLYSQQIRTLPIHVAIARQAILLRAQYNIHVPDALQIATGIEAGASLFVTNDRRLTAVEGIEILLLDDYAA